MVAEQKAAESSQAAIANRGQGTLKLMFSRRNSALYVREVCPPTIEHSTTCPDSGDVSIIPVSNLQMLLVSATTYEDRGHYITRFVWEFAGEQYVAWARADFSLLQQVASFSQGGQDYQLALIHDSESIQQNEHLNRLSRAAGNQGQKQRVADLPELPVEEDTAAIVYYVEVDGEEEGLDQLSAFTAIDDLMTYFHENQSELSVKAANRQVLSEAQKRYEVTHPKEKSTDLTYWINN